MAVRQPRYSKGEFALKIVFNLSVNALFTFDFIMSKKLITWGD
jgi:hypothetical protein